MNNKLINNKKNHSFEYFIFDRKELRKKVGIFFDSGSVSTISRKGSTDPDPHQI